MGAGRAPEDADEELPDEAAVDEVVEEGVDEVQG